MPDYERLSVADNLHLDLEDGSVHMHVAAVMLFEAGPLTREDGGADIERLRAFLESRLHRVPRYRQRLTSIPLEDHPVWVDDANFNLQYHVRHTRLPIPGDDRQLKRLAGRIFSQQLDRGKPLWELWLVEGLQSGRVALIMKVHHCMADGIASTELLSALLALEPQEDFEPPPTWLPRPAPGPVELFRDAVTRRLKAPAQLAGALGSALSDPSRTLAQLREGVESLRAAQEAQAVPASETPLNRRIGPHRRFDWLAADLEQARHIKRALGGTLNDVMLAVAAGALGDLFERHGISPREQRKLDVRAACPVSTRADDERDRLGNRVSSLIVPLPIGELDPVRRLRRVSEATHGLKASHQELGAEIAQAFSEWTWAGIYTAFARNAVEKRSSNLIISNVPGPRAPLYLLGSRMLEAYPLVPLLHNQALGIACLSYDGRLFWGFNSDWDLMPDLHDLVLSIGRQFEELRKAAEQAAAKDTRLSPDAE